MRAGAYRPRTREPGLLVDHFTERHPDELPPPVDVRAALRVGADERTEKRDLVIASGGLHVPSRTRWEPWARWFHLPRLADPMPAFSVPRGGIGYRYPDELLGSKLCLRKFDVDDDDPNTARCHEYLKRDGDRWRCRAGHVWNAVGLRVE